jgi:hypothetical protein
MSSAHVELQQRNSRWCRTNAAALAAAFVAHDISISGVLRAGESIGLTTQCVVVALTRPAPTGDTAVKQTRIWPSIKLRGYPT